MNHIYIFEENNDCFKEVHIENVDHLNQQLKCLSPLKSGPADITKVYVISYVFKINGVFQVIIRKKEDYGLHSGISSRLVMASEVPVTVSDFVID